MVNYEAPYHFQLRIPMEKTLSGIHEISDKLSNEFQRVLPLDLQQLRSTRKLSEIEIRSQTEESLKRFYDFARTEIQARGLGIFARARVAFNLQQRLLDAGYAPTLVKQVLFAMLTAVFVNSK